MARRAVGYNSRDYNSCGSVWADVDMAKDDDAVVGGDTVAKAIETKYRGYRFRSRLEARWAVFLDAWGVSWKYEPEGYDLGDQGWYLPDFYIPSWEMFLAQVLRNQRQFR